MTTLPAPGPTRVQIGPLWIDQVDFPGALEIIERLIDAGGGGAVFTPNVDHVVVADRHPAFLAAYDRADLSLVDGQPLVWAARLLGVPLPAKISGADLLLPLMKLAARRKLRVYLIGGPPGVGEEAAAKLQRDLGVEVVGVESPIIPLAASPIDEALAARVAAARPHLLLAFLGAPKGELFIDRVRDRVAPAVAVQLGASLDFYLGRVKRAPRWMQRLGLEWLFRLSQEPRRLARRYLIEDPKFLAILWRTFRTPRADRVRAAQSAYPLSPTRDRTNRQAP